MDVAAKKGKSNSNSVYFYAGNSISSSTVGLSAALNIIFFLLTRPYFSFSTSDNAVFRIIFILSKASLYGISFGRSRKVRSHSSRSRPNDSISL